MSLQLADKEAELKLVRELKKHEGYTTILLPRLQELAVGHAKACRRKDSTVQERSEHIEAANDFETMTQYLDTLEKSLVQTIHDLKAARK